MMPLFDPKKPNPEAIENDLIESEYKRLMDSMKWDPKLRNVDSMTSRTAKESTRLYPEDTVRLLLLWAQAHASKRVDFWRSLCLILGSAQLAHWLITR